MPSPGEESHDEALTPFIPSPLIRSVLPGFVISATVDLAALSSTRVSDDKYPPIPPLLNTFKTELWAVARPLLVEDINHFMVARVEKTDEDAGEKSDTAGEAFDNTKLLNGDEEGSPGGEAEAGLRNDRPSNSNYASRDARGFKTKSNGIWTKSRKPRGTSNEHDQEVALVSITSEDAIVRETVWQSQRRPSITWTAMPRNSFFDPAISTTAATPCSIAVLPRDPPNPISRPCHYMRSFANHHAVA